MRSVIWGVYPISTTPGLALIVVGKAMRVPELTGARIAVVCADAFAASSRRLRPGSVLDWSMTGLVNLPFPGSDVDYAELRVLSHDMQ